MQKIVLFIDTSSRESIRVAIELNGERFERISSTQGAKAQEVLPMIEELLGEQKRTLADVSSITVHTGPGSYTGLRVGIAIANMLGVLLGIPINGLPVGQQAFPVYEGDRW